MSSVATVREWRWIEEPEPRLIPENWSNQGVEPLEEDHEHWYAGAYKAGTQLEWSIDERDGEPVEGPHREDYRIAIVYVRGDCDRAVVRDYRAEHAGGGWRPDANEYRSVRSFPTDAGGPVSPRNQQDYWRVLVDYYGLDPADDRRVRGRSA